LKKKKLSDMACSKLFSGDLPELINEIIRNFHYDYKTLHSCILVNRLWCRLAIPLLWENPFSINKPKNHHFIDIYLHNLNDNYKTKLNEYGRINNDLFSSNILFNYPSFIKCLDTYEVSRSIKYWASASRTIGISITKSQHSIYFIPNRNLSYPQVSNFQRLIYKSLFLIFIENKVKLNRFEVKMTSHEYSDDAFELIFQKPNFIRDIKNLTIDIHKVTHNITKFLNFLCPNCNSISSLYFLFPFHKYNHSATEKVLSQIINSQENLRKISFGFTSTKYPLYYSLLSLKNPNCSNTLKTIIFHFIDFKNIVVLSEVFNQLNVLESIHIVECYSLDSKFIQQIIEITKPFKLKSLFLNKIDGLLEPLIQKSSNYLEDFGINVRFQSQQLQELFGSVFKYCTNIKFLYLPLGLNNHNIGLVFNLVENIKKNLNYLLIDVTDILDSLYHNNIDDDIELSSMVLQNLGQILPFKLEYLNLGLAINESDLEIFLKKSQILLLKN
jgi:hypothetical protein